MVTVLLYQNAFGRLIQERGGGVFLLIKQTEKKVCAWGGVGEIIEKRRKRKSNNGIT
jgi:hypothetical protein